MQLKSTVVQGLCLSLALGGCGGADPPSSASTLRELFPAQAAAVLEGAGTFSPLAEGFSLVAADGLSLVLPREGRGLARFKAPDGFEVQVQELGADGAGATVGHALAYRRAGGTSYWTAAEGGAEEWLLLDASAVHRGRTMASWEVTGGKVRRVGAVVEIDDAQGVPRLRVTAPAAYASGGRAIDAQLSVQGSRIELSVDAENETVLVDPSWTLTASMNAGRTHFATVLLADGSVLVVGGRGAGNTFLSSAERYNPLTNSWSAAGAITAGREWIRATMLGSGKVLATGGQNAAAAFANADLYDPATNSWAPTAAMPAVRSTHTQTALNDGRALVANGNTATAIVYDPATATWTATGAMSVSRGFSQATMLTGGKVLVTGGNGLNSTELYDPATNLWSLTGAMAQTRVLHRLTTLNDGRVLVTGGTATVGGALLATAELYDPATGLWSNAPNLSAGRQEHTATLLQNGTVLVAGGQNLASTEIFDPASNSWSAGVPMKAARTSHSANLLPNGSVFVASGGAFLKTAEYYSQGLGSSCTTNAQCPSGFCADGVCCNVACNAGACDACSVAAGAPSDGTCAPVANGTVCDDGNGCTQADTCSAGVCTGVSGAGVACNTGLLGACAVGTTVCAMGGLVCTGDAAPSPELCDGVDNDCDGQIDNDLGTISCGQGACASTVPACANGVPAVCSPQPDGTACDDGNACTLTDTCQAGSCTGGDPAACAAPDQCHLAAACNPATGGCDYPNQPDGTPCDDHVQCTLGDACMDGACVPTSPGGCSPEALGVDVPAWASAAQPCSGNAPCDDGGIGVAQPDAGGVYTTELRPFVLSGSYSIAQCGGGLRPLDGGRVHVHSTNLTAFDLAGNDFDGNSLVETQPGWYGYMLQRDLVTQPAGVSTLISYALDSARWDYQGSKSLILALPGALLPAPSNAFTAPPVGDTTINLDKTHLVSVRFEVTSTTPCIGIDALRFTAGASDGQAIGSFASDVPVAGSYAGVVLSPDPATVSGFVLANNAQQQAVATGEVLLEAGHLYRFGNAAVELTDPFGAPLSVVGISPVSVSIPAGQCAPMIVRVSVAMPTGRVRGTMDFPNSGSAIDPSVKLFHASYFGTSDQNGGNGQSAGYNIHGSPTRIATSGAAVSYDYKAIVEGRWAARWPAVWSTVYVQWPGASGLANAGLGAITWPMPGGDGQGAGPTSVQPLDVTSATTSGLDLDGYTYIDANDPVVKPIPNWPPACPQEVFHTETIDLAAPMAYLGGGVHLLGCAGQANISSGTAGISGVGPSAAFPAPTFVDERGHQRTGRVQNQGGVATGVFATNGTGTFETAALQGLWQEGGYVLGLDGEGKTPGAGAYHGQLGAWKILGHREVHALAPGRTQKTQASLVELHTGRVATRLRVKNAAGAAQVYRPFRFPQAYTGVSDYADAAGNVLGAYYASSSGVNAMQVEHVVELIGVSHSVGNLRYQAIVPQNEDGTGRQFWVSLPMLRAIPMDEAVCATCVTIQRGTSGTVADAALFAVNPSTAFGASSALYTGISGNKPTLSLLRFDLAGIPANATVISATMTLTGLLKSGDTTVNVHRVRGAWNEATVKWNNFVVGIDGAAAATFPTTVGPVSTSLKDLVQQWVSGSLVNYGVALEQSAGSLYYASSERPGVTDHPKLSVCYALP